jgi:predicted glycogen debranching enzyme
MLLVSGFDAQVITPAGRFAMASQRYLPDVVAPDGATRIDCFDGDPWPQWRFRLEDGTLVEHEIFVEQATGRTILRWWLSEPRAGVSLELRPFLCGRDYHALHHENGGFRFDAEVRDERVRWEPYPGVPPIVSLANASYRHDPHWYRGFLYTEEQARGLDAVEDLAAPGVLRWDLSREEAAWILGTEPVADGRRATWVAAWSRRQELARRRRFASRLHRSADAYLVRRGGGHTIIAGYPWFTDWGRDTFIALRGLCLATAELDVAASILLQWSGAVSEGMLPNRFPDSGEAPEYNSVDAALWFVICVHELRQALARQGRALPLCDAARLDEAVHAILTGYAAGTRHGIRVDADGLLAAGEPGVQLTWMDAKIGSHVVTPRIGKPVELQALWLNALAIGAGACERLQALRRSGLKSFRQRFWNQELGCLYDVVDVDHQTGVVDARVRPNQIFAVGGLPRSLLPHDQALRVVETVEAQLYTPAGLRTLAQEDPSYCKSYLGGVPERDRAYHQGTVWPWLLGPFVEAWVRVRGLGSTAEARRRFLGPLLAATDALGLGHIPEIADGDPPHAWRGCPFQAWSLGEALRLALVVLAEEEPAQVVQKA